MPTSTGTGLLRLISPADLTGVTRASNSLLIPSSVHRQNIWRSSRRRIAECGRPLIADRSRIIAHQEMARPDGGTSGR